MEKIAVNIRSIGLLLIVTTVSQLVANLTTDTFDGTTIVTDQSRSLPGGPCLDLAAAAAIVAKLRQLSGDITLSFLVRDEETASSIEFVIDHINEKNNLLHDNLTIGYRIIITDDHLAYNNTLSNEVQFQKECMKNALGIFVEPQLWKEIDLLYSIWKLPTMENLLLTKLSKLLSAFPVRTFNEVSFEVLTESIDLYTKFMEFTKREHLCFVNNKRENENVVLVLGNSEEMLPENVNDTLIVVLFEKDDIFISELPDKSFLATENSFPVNNSRDSSKLFPTDVIIAATIFEKILNVLNANTDCAPAEICSHLFVENSNWDVNVESLESIFENMALEHIVNALNYELVQKNIVHKKDNVSLVELNTILSVNLIADAPALSIKHIVKPFKLIDVFYCHEVVTPTLTRAISHPLTGNWIIKAEIWIAVALTIAALGIFVVLIIFVFIMVRVYMKDVLEGNPNNSVALLGAIMLQFISILPFAMEYRSYLPDSKYVNEFVEMANNSLCSFKLFSMTSAYSITFSVLISRGLMLASIGSEGGFLSHVNGYLQTILCMFSVLVQLGLSSQLLIMMQTNIKNLSCQSIYYGHWFWSLIAYDGFLLVFLIFLSPFIFRSKRNYQEGGLIVTAAFLCLIVWTTWLPLCMFYNRDLVLTFGLLATAWSILIGILIPRCFLIIRGLARSEFAQALPSLTSLAFASQQNQYVSEQSVYDATMRQTSMSERSTSTSPDNEFENVPTLPLRNGRESQLFTNLQQELHPKANDYPSIHGFGQSPHNLNSRALMRTQLNTNETILNSYLPPPDKAMTRF